MGDGEEFAAAFPFTQHRESPEGMSEKFLLPSGLFALLLYQILYCFTLLG